MVDALNTAPEPVASVSVTVGVEVYPLPGLVRVTVAIEPVEANDAVREPPDAPGVVRVTNLIA